MEDLAQSISQYEDQLAAVKRTLQTAQGSNERESLLAFQSELEELINLARESLIDVQKSKNYEHKDNNCNSNELDDEYALLTNKTAETGVYDENKETQNKPEGSGHDESDDSDDSNIDPQVMYRVYLQWLKRVRPPDY